MRGLVVDDHGREQEQEGGDGEEKQKGAQPLAEHHFPVAHRRGEQQLDGACAPFLGDQAHGEERGHERQQVGQPAVHPVHGDGHAAEHRRWEPIFAE